MKLNFRELEVIWAVLSEGSMSAASRRLNVTQPAISMMLRQAQARLGFPLFDRQGNRISPTSQLTELYPQLELIFAGLGELSLRIQQIRHDALGTLRIGTTTALSDAFVTSALNDLQMRFPDIKPTLESLTNDQVVSGVETGRFDIGIAISPSRAAGVSSRAIGTTEIVCIMRSDDSLCRQEVVSVDDIAARRVISYRAETVFGVQLGRCFAEHGHRFRPAVETSALNAIALVSQGAGIGLIDGLVVRRRRHPELTVRPFVPKLPGKVFLLKSGRRNPAVALFESGLRAALAALQETPIP